MKPVISLSRALGDEGVFGNTFGASSFWTWWTVAKLIDGIPLVNGPKWVSRRRCAAESVFILAIVQSVILAVMIAWTTQ